MEAVTHSIAGKFLGMSQAAVTVRQDRCAKVRNRNVQCLKCAEACTSGCISVVDGELVIDASKCVGCGTCATVCPTCALEARSPCDAELERACEAAVAGGECVITCQPLLAACEDLVNEARVAQVACLGRVDESLVASLAAAGVERVTLACGPCEACAQRHGEATAQLVAHTANDLLDACGSAARAQVVHGMPASVLAPGVTPADAQAAFEYLQNAGCACKPVAPAGVEPGAGELTAGEPAAPATLPHVMSDGTLPHFLPERRERLLDALQDIGEPARPLTNRLWGTVVIDGGKCVSCRMCATFCPTGAIRKFDDADGTFGVLHFPGDCVKCASCRDICPEGAILLLDQVKPSYITQGDVHRYVMRPREVEIDDPHQIWNTMKRLIPGNTYER